MTREEATTRWRIKHKAFATLMGVCPRLCCEPTRLLEWPRPTLFRQGDGRTYVEDIASIGLRWVGIVIPESYGHYQHTFLEGKREDSNVGWCTDPDGWVMKDGDGLCWGEVYQLPTRRRGALRMQFVAGYQFGGCDNGPVIDFGRIFNDGSYGCDSRVRDIAAAREAARHADEMARVAAEEECEYRREQMEEDDEDAA